MVRENTTQLKKCTGSWCPGENKGAQDESGGGGADVQDLITTLRIWRVFFLRTVGSH